MALKKLIWAPAKADIVKQSSEIISPEINEAIASLSESERADYEERAAIMEYDGGLARAEAERRALEIVTKFQKIKEAKYEFRTNI